MPRSRRLYAALLGCAVVAVPGVVAATPATAAATSVALVGDLQSELGLLGRLAARLRGDRADAGR